MSDSLTPEDVAKDLVEARDEADSAHRRLRNDFREFEDRAYTSFTMLRDRIGTLETRVEGLSVSVVNPDVVKLRFSTPVMVAVIVASFTVASTGIATAKMVLGRIDDLSGRLALQQQQQAQERASTSKLLDERYQNSQSAINALTRQMELLKYEQQRLREDMVKTGRSPK